jgi:hypothetical protein
MTKPPRAVPQPDPRVIGWVTLRRRVVIAGFALAALNTVLVYSNNLGARSRAALQVLSDLQAAYSQPTVRNGQPCMNYVAKSFDANDLAKLWANKIDGVAKPPAKEAENDLEICLAEFDKDKRGQATIINYYIRRQVLGYLNVHELAVSALTDNNVDNYKLCKEWEEYKDGFFLIDFIKKAERELPKDEFARSYPALHAFQHDNVCPRNGFSRYFRNYVSFLLPF